MRTGMMRRLLAAFALAAVAALACAALAGCDSTDDRKAGQVFDYVISEQDVADYLAEFREGSANTSDEDWAAWMGKMGTNATKLRKEVINYLGQNWLVERAAQLRGVSVSDDEVEAKLEEQKSKYTSSMAFTRSLINSGYTEEYYKLSIKSDLLREKIKETFSDPAGVSDKDLESYASMQMSNRRTRRSSAIFIESTEGSSSRMSAKAEANDARNELKAGKSFDEVFAKYSSTAHSKDGDMGYDMVSVPCLEYRDAVDKLGKKGAVSDVVTASDGFYVIVLTDIFEVPDGVKYHLKQYPSALVDAWRNELASQGNSDEYDAFMKENVSDAQVAVEPMPEGLAYDVEPTGSASSSAQGSDSSSASDESSGSSDGAGADAKSE